MNMRVLKFELHSARTKVLMNADALATAAKSSGLSPDQVIAWKRAQALSALANSKAGVLVNVK